MKRKAIARRKGRHPSVPRLRRPGGDIARGVHTLLKTRVEEGCERAWSELADLFGVATLFPHSDPSTLWAQSGVRVIIDDLTRQLTKLTLAALLLPSTTSGWRPRRLVALRAGSNDNGRVRGTQ